MRVSKNLQDFSQKKFLLGMNIQAIFLTNKLSITEKLQKVFGSSSKVGRMMDA
jgi:hypothetical protein